MNISFYTGVSGLSAYQEGMNLISNNVANVNTVGYKPMAASFKDLVYTNMDTNSEEEILVGHGIKVDAANLSFQQGNMLQTGNELDFAISGNGLFAVDDKGVTKYTRNGAMTISVEGNEKYLCMNDGSYVLDNNGEKIEIPMKNITNDDGKVTGSEPDFSKLQDQIGIFTFANPHGLSPMDGGKYLPTNISGEAVSSLDETSNAGDLIAYTLESSGVDLADEMSAMMIMQKAYQFSAKVVQTADQIEEIVNNLR